MFHKRRKLELKRKQNMRILQTAIYRYCYASFELRVLKYNVSIKIHYRTKWPFIRVFSSLGE